MDHKEISTFLTNNADVDGNILLELPDSSLARYFTSCKYFAKIGDDPEFWRRKMSSSLKHTFPRKLVDYRGMYKLLAHRKTNRNLLRAAARSGFLELVEVVYHAELDAHNAAEAMIEAAEAGHVAVIAFFVGHGISIYGVYGIDVYLVDECVPSSAAANGHLAVIEYLVRERIMSLHDWHHALYVAARAGHLSIVKFLVNSVFFEVNDPHKYYSEALVDAARSGQLDVIKFLVDIGADLHIDNEKPLSYAASSGNLRLIEYLVTQGADINANNGQAMVNAIGGKYISIAKYLLDHGAKIDELMLEAVRNGDTEIVDLLRSL